MRKSSAPAAETDLLRPDRIFAGLAGVRGLVAAVSGGADSTALMVLLAGWHERPPVLIITVDHGLRAEAAGETLLVARNAAALGLPCRIMRAPERTGAGNLQDWARRARYALLVSAARDAGYDAVVTAHHQDDQAETFLMRLARGSGVYGLAAMAEAGSIDGVRLIRPLLDAPREALAAVASASGLASLDDPSNADPTFDRVRLRRLMPALAEHGLTAKRLAGTARQMRRAAGALDHYARKCLAESFEADPFGAVSGPADTLARVPEETALRALALVCQAVGGADYTPRLDRLESLLAAVLDGARSGRFKRTLHGASFELARGRLTARRERGREGLSVIPAPGGASILWDRRFRLNIPERAPERAGGTHVGPLGGSGRRLRLTGGGSALLHTLPGLYNNGLLLALPQGVDAADDGPALDRLAAECLVGGRLGLGAVQPVRSP